MTVVILAAGTSSRMNGSNKLLLEWNAGESLLEHTIRTALSFTDKVYVVTGHERRKVLRIILSYPVKEIFNENFEEGQESSIRIAAEEIDDSLYYIPGDLPLLTKRHLISAMFALAGHEAARPVFNGTVGHPVAISRELLEVIRKNKDEKVKDIIASADHNFYEDDEAVCADVDTEEAYKELKQRFAI